jgi:hypothetical protein
MEYYIFAQDHKIHYFLMENMSLVNNIILWPVLQDDDSDDCHAQSRRLHRPLILGIKERRIFYPDIVSFIDPNLQTVYFLASSQQNYYAILLTLTFVTRQIQISR